MNYQSLNRADQIQLLAPQGSHQNGTCRFGTNPATSVLDLHCKAHDVQNLYVVDASFFVSCGAFNPSLTIAANALRVGDHILNDVLGLSQTLSKGEGFKNDALVEVA